MRQWRHTVYGGGGIALVELKLSSDTPFWKLGWERKNIVGIGLFLLVLGPQDTFSNEFDHIRVLVFILLAIAKLSFSLQSVKIATKPSNYGHCEIPYGAQLRHSILEAWSGAKKYCGYMPIFAGFRTSRHLF